MNMSIRLLLVIGSLVFDSTCYQHLKQINIVVFLSPGDDITEDALISAINRLNLFHFSDKYVIYPTVHRISEKDILKAGQLLCDQIENEDGVAAIFGPEQLESNEMIQSVSASLEIPQFQTFWNSKLTSFSTQTRFDKHVQVFNLYPSPYILARALATLIRENDWKTYTIIYESDDAFIRLQDLLKVQRPRDSNIKLKKIGTGPDHRTLLKEIKISGELQIILDCEADQIINILSQAEEVGLMEEYHSYILTSLDAHTVDWSSLKTLKSNVTAIRIVDPTGNGLPNVVKDWELVEIHHQSKIEIPANKVGTKTALLYDAINLFITVFSQLEATQELVVKPLSCNKDETSSHGFRLSAYVKLRNTSWGILPGPLTGPITFDDTGQRSSFKLQIIETERRYTEVDTAIRDSDDIFRVAGTWDSQTPYSINYTFSSEDREKELAKTLQEKTFRVVSRPGAPYFIEKNGTNLRGNDRFEGYAVDLMHGICEILKCNYTFEIVPDRQYGSYDPKTGEWNGLIRHLLDRKADLAVCDLTITYERRRAVDFTVPFMTLGISILFAKAVKEPPDLLSFTEPLSLDVWLYMATAYLVISMIIFLVARLNPNEWENPHPCNPCPQELENIWNVKNCCWLTLGSIMAQGCDILPKGASTRVVTGMWWFFSLIMTASYTANLAAFLTNERMGPTIESAEDLAAQTQIKYGCLAGGATSSFFRDSNFSTYHRMWVQMESADPSVFETSNADGVKRVLSSKRKYAFLMESSSIEYEMERNCELMEVGHWLDTKGYGIAMPTNAGYRKKINGAILKMQELGILHHLKKKWWKEKHVGGKCEQNKQSTETTATELGLLNVGGVFVVLAGGVSIALLFAVCEFLWNVRKVAVSQHMTLSEAFNQEMRFAVNIWARKKIVRSGPPEAITMSYVADNPSESATYMSTVDIGRIGFG